MEGILSRLSDELSFDDIVRIQMLLNQLIPRYLEHICDTQQKMEYFANWLRRCENLPQHICVWVEPQWWNQYSHILYDVKFTTVSIYPVEIDQMTQWIWIPPGCTVRSGFSCDIDMTMKDDTVILTNKTDEVQILPYIKPLHSFELETRGLFTGYTKVDLERVDISVYNGSLNVFEFAHVMSTTCPVVLGTKVQGSAKCDGSNIMITPHVLKHLDQCRCDNMQLILDDDLSDLEYIQTKASGRRCFYVKELKLDGRLARTKEKLLNDIVINIFGWKTRIDTKLLRLF